MSVPITASYGTIVVKALTDLPARILGGTGIQVNVQGFDYRIDVDIQELQVSPLGSAPGKWTMVWDEIDQTYKRIEFTQLPPPNNDWSTIINKPATFPPTLPIAQSGVTNLVADLAAKLDNNAPTDGKTYGRKNGAWQDVAAGVTIVVNWTDIVGKPSTFPPSAHTHPESEVTNLVTDLAARELIANKGAASGYAPLDGTSKVPVANLPAAALWPEAPTDGRVYGREGQSPSWQPITGRVVAQTDNTGGGYLPVGTTAQRPSGAAGLIRFNSETVSFEGYNGTSWAGIGGGVYVGLTAPANPRNGDLWWKSDVGLMLLYYNDGTSTQWVVANPSQDIAALDTRYAQGSGIAGCFKISSGSLVAAAAQIDIPLPAGYPGGFELLLHNIIPVTDLQTLGLRFSMDGSTFLAANYAWSFNMATSAGANAPLGNQAGTLLALNTSQSNSVNPRGHFKVNIASTPSGICPAAYFLGHLWSGTNYCSIHGSGLNTTVTGPALAVRVLYGAGNIAAGVTWQLNGIR